MGSQLSGLGEETTWDHTRHESKLKAGPLHCLRPLSPCMGQYVLGYTPSRHCTIAEYALR